MIAIAAASAMLNSMPGTRFIAIAPNSVKKMPNCAAAPRMIRLGRDSIGPKSVIAPTPMKISSGKMPLSMPAL